MVATKTCEWRINRPPASFRLSDIILRFCTGAIALNRDGTTVAVSNRTGIAVFDVTKATQTGTQSGGADKLLGSPSGEFFLAQSLDGNTQAGTVRILRFDNGEVAFRSNRIRSSLALSQKYDPWRSKGVALEFSADMDYRTVGSIYWRKDAIIVHQVRVGAPNTQLVMIGVAEDLDQTVWWDYSPQDDQRRLLFASENRGIGWADSAFAAIPEWRVFSRDGTQFAAESDGRVVAWNVATGRVVADLGDVDVRCELWGGTAILPNKVVAVCRTLTGDGRTTSIRALMIPGATPLASVAVDSDWNPRGWLMSINGLRMAVWEVSSGKAVSQGNESYRVRTFNLGNGRPSREVLLSDRFTGEEDDLTLSADGRRLAARLNDGRVLIYSTTE